MYLGNIAGGTNCTFDGLIDEVRLSDTERNACWIKANYNNQCEPGVGNCPGTSSITVHGPADLADHAAGQQGNAFVGGDTVTGAQLFGFKLTNNETGTVTVDQVVFQLSAVTGIVEGDFTES
jgi:hypothetical protein